MRNHTIVILLRANSQIVWDELASIRIIFNKTHDMLIEPR